MNKSVVKKLPVNTKAHRINELLIDCNLPQKALFAIWNHWNLDRNRLYRLLQKPESKLYADEERCLKQAFKVTELELYQESTL